MNDEYKQVKAVKIEGVPGLFIPWLNLAFVGDALETARESGYTDELEIYIKEWQEIYGQGATCEPVQPVKDATSLSPAAMQPLIDAVAHLSTRPGAFAGYADQREWNEKAIRVCSKATDLLHVLGVVK